MRWFYESVMADDLEAVAVEAGWTVRREWHVGKRRRVDLRLDSPYGAVLVELKGPAGARTTMSKSTAQLEGYLDVTPGVLGLLVFGSVGSRGRTWMKANAAPRGMLRCEMPAALELLERGPARFFKGTMDFSNSCLNMVSGRDSSHGSHGSRHGSLGPGRTSRHGSPVPSAPGGAVGGNHGGRGGGTGGRWKGHSSRRHPQWLSIIPEVCGACGKA